MRFELCYKCGKRKLASFNIWLDSDKVLTHDDLEMNQMTYGKNRGKFRCNNCKEESKIKEFF